MAGNKNKKGSKSSQFGTKTFLESSSMYSANNITSEKPSASTGERSTAANKRRKSLYNSRCKPGGDILNPTAIQNAYYICHNVQDCLFFRGFKWLAENKGKKSGKK